MEFNTEFIQTTCLGASIYRLQEFKFASDLNLPRQRPDGQLCNWLSKFARYSFLNRAL
jgi:hypothetical protein